MKIPDVGFLRHSKHWCKLLADCRQPTSCFQLDTRLQIPFLGPKIVILHSSRFRKCCSRWTMVKISKSSWIKVDEAKLPNLAHLAGRSCRMRSGIILSCWTTLAALGIVGPCFPQTGHQKLTSASYQGYADTIEWFHQTLQTYVQTFGRWYEDSERFLLLPGLCRGCIDDPNMELALEPSLSGWK